MEFKLTDLLAYASQGVKYNPALGVALNTLINTSSKIEYQEALQTATQLAIGYGNVQIGNRKEYGYSSNLEGMPLFQPLLLKGANGVSDLLLESAVVEGNRSKNIGSTVIQGRDTSVDEWINNGDYQINVRGILCNNQPRWPKEQFEQLNAFLNLNVPIKIEHEKLNAAGVYEILILSDGLLQASPYINCQPYSFTCKSTKALPLIIEQKQLIA